MTYLVPSVVPPSQIPTPFNGQFEAAFKLNPLAGPPLSVVKTMIESFSIFFCASASTTFPTDSSNLYNIAANFLLFSS